MKSQPVGESQCAEKPAAIITGQSQAEGIAKFAARVTYEDLTPERRERLKISILDSLACAFNALGAPPIAACLAQAKEFGGPNGRCTLIGGGKANVVYAALYNTALVRYIDFMTVTSLDPSSVILLTTPERCSPPASTPDDQAKSS
jgi:2-methylcitrate dehydratase